jgi:hypothetical protein
MASPLFYLVGAIVGKVANWDDKNHGTRLSCPVLVLLPLSLERRVPQQTMKRSQTVAATSGPAKDSVSLIACPHFGQDSVWSIANVIDRRP